MPDEKTHNLPDQSGSWFQNRGLFSDHFLQARLPEWKEWKVDAELVPFRESLQSLYDSKKPILPYLNEAQTELEFVQPVLDLLGYANSYIVQAPTKVGQHTNRPDYALFPDVKTKNKAYQKLDQNDYSLCIGIADAKYWERELDLAKSSDRDTFTNQNPSFQIAGYLTGTKQNWGILTNGRLWRLYSSKSHLPLGNYYQVDIVKLLEEAPVEIFKYFYVLFRKQALLQVEGKSLLDRILEGSEEYAVELEADIKERAYDVVELLCRGFAADFIQEKLTDGTLKSIYDNSLTLLYRLLFAFYAEARELLPLTTNASYRENYSLRKLTHDIDEIFKKGYDLSTSSTQYYHYISSLFHLVNNGDSKLGVPEYNGGLFEPIEHPFLERQAIPDAYLVRAIHQLARITDKKLKREVAVDYNTLSERHLGSIYEGLLEFKPLIAPHDLVVVKDKGGIKYASANKHPGRKIAYTKDELYLANDKGERKASGSYYTPEYIVNYIVENTLDPLVKEAHEKVKALKPEVGQEIEKWQKLKEQKQGLEPTEKYDRKIAEESERLLGPYLSLKVLDPAMGSGHFLARATDFLAEAIATDPDIKSPLELTEESELTYYRRRVVESCIYGVDLNPLAVELAKLTLWLTTMAKSKPLSFLNHHLRVGNSLIGARVADLDEIPKAKGKKKAIDLSRAPVQLGLFQQAFNQKLYDLLQNRALIAQLPTETLEDVHNKQKWEKDFEHNMKRFRMLADTWVSTFFGNDVRWDEYNTLIENLQSSDPAWEKLIEKKYVQNSLNLRESYRFFHWELEFPEVFFDQNGQRIQNPGFSAVVGNPPYVLTSSKEDPEQVAEHFRQRRAIESLSFGLLWGRWDIFVAFVERALALVQASGSHSFIVSHAIEFAPYAELLRKHLSQEWTVVAVVHFGDFEVFPGVGVNPIVYQVKNSKPTTSHEVRYAIWRDSSDADPETVWSETQHSVANALRGPAGSLGFPNIATGGTLRLSDLCFISGGAQIQSDQETRRGDFTKDDLIAGQHSAIYNRPYIEGKDIDRYLVDMVRFVAFDAFASKMKRPRFKELFENCKLIIGLNSKAALDNGSEPNGFFYPNHSVILGVRWCDLSGVNNRSISKALRKTKQVQSDSERFRLEKLSSSYDLHYILALANSRLLRGYERVVIARHPIFLTEDALKDYPIRRINFTTKENQRKQLLAQGKELYHEYLQSQDNSRVLAFVDQRLPQKPDSTPDTESEQSDVVHDLLAFLAEEMTRLNEEKQSKIKHFLTWLEKDILKGSIEDQKNKTKIRNFHEGALEELIDVLKKNKVIPDPCPSNIWDTISGEFSTTVNALTPLKARIEATDKLIDQIVYKLYGLNKDEVAIVEG